MSAPQRGRRSNKALEEPSSRVAEKRQDAADESRIQVIQRQLTQKDTEISSLMDELKKLKREKAEYEATGKEAKRQLEELIKTTESEKEENSEKNDKEIEKIKREKEALEKERADLKEREQQVQEEKKKLHAEEITGQSLLERGEELTKRLRVRRDELVKEIDLRNKLIDLTQKLQDSAKKDPNLISGKWELPKIDEKTPLNGERFDINVVGTFLERIRYVGTEKDKGDGLDGTQLTVSEIIGAHFIRGGMVLHYKSLHKNLCKYIVSTLTSKKQGENLNTRDSGKNEAHELEKEYESITLIDKQLRRNLSQGEWCSLKFYTGDSDLTETEMSRSVKLAFLLFEGDGAADSRFFRRYDYFTRELARSALSGQMDLRDNRVQTSNTEINTADNNLKQLLGTLSEVARIIQHECRYASELVNQDLRALNVMMEDYQEQKLAVTKLIYSNIMLPISRIIVLLFLANRFPHETTQEVWSETIVSKLLNPMKHISLEKYALKMPGGLDEDMAAIYNCVLVLLHSDRSPVGRGDGEGAIASTHDRE